MNNFPFHKLGHNGFMAENPQRQDPLNRQARQRQLERNVQEEHTGVDRANTRYTDMYTYWLRPNDFELRVNLQNIFDRMSAHIRAGNEYRIRIVHENNERLVEVRGGGGGGDDGNNNIERRTRVILPREWFDEDGNVFEEFVDTVTRFFVSNEDIFLFDVRFYLDVYDGGQVAGGGGFGTEGRLTQTSLKAKSASWSACNGLFYIPANCDNLCGWMALYRATSTENAALYMTSLKPWMRRARTLMEECGGTENLFNLQHSSELFVKKFPRKRIAIFKDVNPTPTNVIQGAEWEVVAEAAATDKNTVMLLYDFVNHHIDWIKSPLFFRSDKYVLFAMCRNISPLTQKVPHVSGMFQVLQARVRQEHHQQPRLRDAQMRQVQRILQD